ncbi:MAG: helix-turn-helix transcriptional regulator [Anaerolineae bacterium]|nr:helix-turn-helix transcriptional regulator [Anaerolineae bacterium]
MSRHHRWRGGRGDGVCPRRIDHFLEPCLLLLLHCREAHGYELLEDLKPFGFDRDPVDSSTVYRFLRAIEELGLVTSRWDAGNAGPARRLYRLAEEGNRYLAGWVADLRETDRVLHHFLETYDTHMAQHQ